MSDIIHNFLKDCSELPHNSYKALCADCKNIAEYLEQTQKQISELSENNAVQDYADFLIDSCSPNTVKRRICTLRKLFHWCESKGLINSDSTYLSVNIEETDPQYASENDIKKLYGFCRNIFETDGYTFARAKFECYLVISMGFKVSELKKLCIDDLIHCKDNTAKMFLTLRKQFVSERLIRSNLLFITKYGGENSYIHSDFNLVKQQCGIDKSVTLSSIRNTCIINFDSIGKNETLTTSFFNVTIERIKKMREHNLIIRLPCEVGSTVYMLTNVRRNSKIISGKIDRFIIGDLGTPLADICTDDNVWYYACSYPEDYFLTYQEAQNNSLKYNIKKGDNNAKTDKQQ